MVSKDLLFLKNYSALEWENRFILGLNTAKYVPVISKNAAIKSCPKLNFLQKICGFVSLSLVGVELEGAKHLLCTGMEK